MPGTWASPAREDSSVVLIQAWKELRGDEREHNKRGPSPSRLSDALRRRLPPFTRRLDWLVVGSTAEDQVASLPRLLERYPPQSVLWSGNVDASFSSRQVDEMLAENGTPIIDAEQGQKLDLGDGARDLPGDHHHVRNEVSRHEFDDGL